MFKLNYNNEIDALNLEIGLLKKAVEQRDTIPKDLHERIAELEVKMAKLWSILTEISPNTGAEKASKYAKVRFGGKDLFNIRPSK